MRLKSVRDQLIVEVEGLLRNGDLRAEVRRVTAQRPVLFPPRGLLSFLAAKAARKQYAQVSDFSLQNDSVKFTVNRTHDAKLIRESATDREGMKATVGHEIS